MKIVKRFVTIELYASFLRLHEGSHYRQHNQRVFSFSHAICISTLHWSVRFIIDIFTDYLFEVAIYNPKNVKMAIYSQLPIAKTR